MLSKPALRTCLIAVCGLTIGSKLSADTIFYGPTGYLSDSDIPAGFYVGGTPTALEDFEDGTLSFGITASAGAVIPPGFIGLIDSVDGDDGTIDGSGLAGHSWFFGTGSTGVTFTFLGPLPTAAGLVWTDGAGTTTFEAFGPGMVSLGTIGPVSIAGAGFTGQTAEDRFFGVQSSGGILAIKIKNSSGGIEVDHVQYGSAPAAVPLPSALAMLASLAPMSLFFLGRLRKRIINFG